MDGRIMVMTLEINNDKNCFCYINGTLPVNDSVHIPRVAFGNIPLDRTFTVHSVILFGEALLICV